MNQTQSLISCDGIEKIIQNVQLYPSFFRVEINDKFTKTLFKSRFKSNGNHGIIEKKNFFPVKGDNQFPRDIVTKFSISNGIDDFIDLSEFDRAVLSACISEQKTGNHYTTINIIFRALIGKVGKVNAIPYKNQRAAIENSIKKLISTVIDFKNVSQNLIALGYLKDGDSFNLKTSSILPAALLDCRINGQFVEDVLYFDRQSPLLDIAEFKNQILRYPASLLDVPNQRNTPLTITLKNYIIRRVAEIKLHKQLVPTITFDDVFKKCDIDVSNRHKKLEIRDYIIAIFCNLKNLDFINHYEVLKKNISIYGISLK